MMEIKIKRLSLENFKCHRHLELHFDGANASIYGDNATGKTSVYDALTWLLFGKDSKGNGEKNIEIKPLNEFGEVRDHLEETAVEAVLLVNGEELALRRTLKEVWTTKRGSTEATYDGNTSEYYIDGVPCKKYAFSDKIDELVSEDTFRLLTSVSHFADGMSWQDRRAVLFKVASVAGDEQIMETDERFRPLIEGMGRLSVDDYKKKLVAEKRGFVGAKTEIPARISECQKTIEDVQGMDFAAARAKIAELTMAKEAREAELLSIERNTAAENKRIEIREVQLELAALDNENKVYRASQMAGAPDVVSMKSAIGQMSARYDEIKRKIRNDNAYIDSLNEDIASARSRWIAVNAESFTGGNCPTCGQALPAAQIKAATDSFEAQKKKRLAEIEQTANANKAAKEAALDRISSAEVELAGLDRLMEQQAKGIMMAERNTVSVADLEGYSEKRAAIGQRIDALHGELADMMADTSSARAKINDQIKLIKGEIDSWYVYLGKEPLLEYSRTRIAELQEDARKAAAALDMIEQMLFLIDEYSRYKTQFIEDSINRMFRIARFRLFREQANGGVEARCDVVYEGVPYINLNSGAKINVGIDIINTLSTAYGVNVPLFVDNAESVTRLEGSSGQIIRLVVSENDKELRINYEN